MEQSSMRFGISSASYFDRLPNKDIFSDFAAHSLKDCELFLNSWSEYLPDYIAALKEHIDALPCKPVINSIHPMSTQFEPQLFSSHPSQHKDALFLYEQVLKAASALGAKIYVMHGPIILQNGANTFSVQRFVPIFRDLSQMASAYGVTLSLENVSWCLFSKPDIGKSLADALGEDLHYTLDVKQACRSGEGMTPKDYIRAVGPLLVNVHLCDHIRTESGFRWILPGKGESDWAGLIAQLYRAGYTGKCFIEAYSNSYENTDELYASLKYLQTINQNIEGSF